MYIRFQSLHPNARGTHPGIFAVANGLARDGVLNEVDAAWWRTSNDWGNAAYPNPSEADPTVFDRALNPSAAAWFKTSATELVEYARGYVEMVARYGVAIDVIETDDPGVIIYDDAVQVVAVPLLG